MKYNIKYDGRGEYEQDIINHILEDRGIENINDFLYPTNKYMLPLDDLKNLREACAIIDDAIFRYKTICIFADSDVDGTTSGAIIYRYLCNVADVDKLYWTIPEGKNHGLSSMDLSVFDNADLIIIVDSLDSDIKYYKKLHDSGKQIIVLDHHNIDPSIRYSDYVTLVSSQNDYPNPDLSGAGVCLKTVLALDELFYDTNSAEDYFDLAACGILADVSNVSESSMENRFIVNVGLNNLRNPALKKIVGGFEFDSTSVLFSVAPKVNSCNRLGKNHLAMETFLSNDDREVKSLLKQLEQCKKDQDTEVDWLLPDVIKQCDEQIDNKVLIASIDTNNGIAGLIANKLIDKYQRPVCIVKDYGSKLSGSMRSPNNFMDFGNNSGLAEFHGHDNASGFSILKSNVEAFIKYCNENYNKEISENSIDVDVLLNVEDITKTLIEGIKQVNKVSGNGWKPVQILVTGITEYEHSSFKNPIHLRLITQNGLNIIKWNYGEDQEVFDDDAMLGIELNALGSLDSGFFGRNFVLKLICSEIGEVN